MRIKNFTLLFLMGFFGLFSFSAQAQQDASFDPANIRYWIGEGQNEVVFIVNWAEPDTALAWGYRFDEESVTVKDMMTEIMETDPRFSFDGGGGFVSEIAYEDASMTLQGTLGGYWMYNVNGVMSSLFFNAQTVVNGDYVKWGDSNCGTVIDPENWIYVWEKEVTAVYPYAVEATIDPADIRYWIGEGQNEAILAVNWAEPNVCYAWGYRFDGETATVKDMMDAIAEADSRFAYEGGGGMVMEITYTTEVEQLGLVGPYWMYNVNGGMAWYGYDEQTIVNGDFVKFGDIDCATEIAQWSYVWETAVTAVYPYAVETMIDPADIHYWIGEGQNEAILAVNWAEPNVCYAWGYRFDGENVTVKDMMDAIAEADSRFAYEGAGGMVMEITFTTELEQLGLVGPYWMYNINGGMAWSGYNEQTIVNGDFVKFGDIACATEIAEWTYVWETEVTALYPYAFEAKIDPSEILFWIGEGQNEVILAVNWAEPNVCYAWGYRYNGENVTVENMLDAIAAADTRFDYQGGGGMVTDITFNTEEEHLALVGPYWMYNINGSMAWYGYDEQTLVSGDFVKFGDISCATEIGQWTYVWECPVQPVVNNTGVEENQLTMSLYPNPASSYTQLDVQLQNQATVTITDLQGRLLDSFVMDQNSEPVRIETSSYEAGVYFVTISDASYRQTMKLVVK